MSEHLEIELTASEAAIAVYVLEKIAQVSQPKQQLLSTFYNVERIEDAKSVLRKLRRATKARTEYLDGTVSSTRGLSSAKERQLDKLEKENTELRTQATRHADFIDHLRKAASSRDIDSVRALLSVESYYVADDA